MRNLTNERYNFLQKNNKNDVIEVLIEKFGEISDRNLVTVGGYDEINNIMKKIKNITEDNFL